MISYYIAFYTNKTINWGLASALAMVLSLCVLLLLGLYGLDDRALTHRGEELREVRDV